LRATQQGIIDKSKASGATNLRELTQLKLGMKRQKERLILLQSKHEKKEGQKLRNKGNRFYKICFHIVRSKLFIAFYSLLIIGNAAVIATDRYPSNDD
jgi:hypothetical protein